MARTSFEVPCIVRVTNTFESLEAHVELPDEVLVQPGDEVCVEGGEIVVPFGESVTLNRTAVVTRASLAERTWTRLTGDLEFMELCEFSFSSGRKL
ncbi:MAG: hypothetical protein ACOYLQ_07870 [Hyphomicrobiaceae bacterium]